MRIRSLIPAAVVPLFFAALLPEISAAASPGTFTSPATCTITGTAGSDTLTGTTGNDVICGLGGNDRIFGVGGSDNLIGGSGSDRLQGGAGRDMLIGGSGHDSLVGGSEVDSLIGGAGSDTLTAGTAGDTCANDPVDVIRGICQADGTGPAISEVTAPSSLDAGTTLSISWQVSDPSGLRIPDLSTPTTWVVVGGPNGYVAWCDFPTPAQQVSGDMNTGLFTASCAVPVNAVNGEYSFTLDALDVFGNHPSVVSTGTFAVTGGATDSASPVISDITLSGTTFAAGDSITFEWNATDDSGVAGAIPWAFSPNGFLVNLATGQLWLDYSLGTLVSGTVLDGHYRVTLKLSNSATSGVYAVWFSTNDVLGNRSFAPVGTTFKVT